MCVYVCVYTDILIYCMYCTCVCVCVCIAILIRTFVLPFSVCPSWFRSQAYGNYFSYFSPIVNVDIHFCIN
jgi:hypothetical protein